MVETEVDRKHCVNHKVISHELRAMQRANANTQTAMTNIKVKHDRSTEAWYWRVIDP